MVIQAITIPDQRYDHARQSVDFIKRYIFPGGFLPSPESFQAALDRNNFTLEKTHFFGASYAHTCALWNKQFQHAWPQVEAMGYSTSFKRMWEYYLSYCEAGFKTGCIDVGLFKIKKTA